MSADEKSKGIDILKEINSEVKKEQPNGKKLSRLIERLKGASKNLPEIIQTTEAIINILSKLLGHN